MDPEFWGPGLWIYLHSTAAVAYTGQKRNDFVNLINVLAKTLPCDKCVQHFRKNMRTLSIRNYLKDNETLFLWTYLMHDAVNEAQGKTGAERPSFETVYRIYFDVGDDQGANFEEDYQNAICKEVCGDASAQIQKQENTTQQSSSKNSNPTRKYKSRR